MSANTSLALAATAPAADRDNVIAPWGESGAARQDHFVRRDGLEFAGTHLIVDFWGGENFDDIGLMERALRAAVAAGGATLLHIHLHHFDENGGISGVAVLAESHISVHTWPERGFAAFDVFMCGDAKPQRSIDALASAFKPGRVDTHTCLRGMVTDDD